MRVQLWPRGFACSLSRGDKLPCSFVNKYGLWIQQTEGSFPPVHSSPAAACAPMERPKVIAVPCEVATTGATGYSQA